MTMLILLVLLSLVAYFYTTQFLIGLGILILWIMTSIWCAFKYFEKLALKSNWLIQYFLMPGIVMCYLPGVSQFLCILLRGHLLSSWTARNKILDNSARHMYQLADSQGRLEGVDFDVEDYNRFIEKLKRGR